MGMPMFIVRYQLQMFLLRSSGGVQVLQSVVHHNSRFGAGDFAFWIKFAARIQGVDIVFQRTLNASLVRRLKCIRILDFNRNKLDHRQIAGILNALNEQIGEQFLGDRFRRINIRSYFDVIVVGVNEGVRVPGVVFYLRENSAGYRRFVEINSCKAKLKAAGDELYALGGCYLCSGQKLGIGDAFDQALLFQGTDFVFTGYAVNVFEAAVSGKNLPC